MLQCKCLICVLPNEKCMQKTHSSDKQNAC